MDENAKRRDRNNQNRGAARPGNASQNDPNQAKADRIDTSKNRASTNSPSEAAAKPHVTSGVREPQAPPEPTGPPLFRESDLAGRLIFETEHTTLHQAAYRVPGYLIVQPKSAAETLGQLAPEALADFFSALLLAETFVNRVVQPERVYLLKFAEFLPQLHMHVLPRTAFLGRAYQHATAQAPPFDGAALTTWLWKHHGTLGFSDDDLDLFVTRARAALAASRTP